MVEPHYDDFPLRRQGVRHYDENVKVGHFLVPVTTTATTTTAKILVVVVGEGGVRHNDENPQRRKKESECGEPNGRPTQGTRRVSSQPSESV